jgi:fructose-bisphosphate aldolase class 1
MAKRLVQVCSGCITKEGRADELLKFQNYHTDFTPWQNHAEYSRGTLEEDLNEEQGDFRRIKSTIQQILTLINR